MSKFRYDINALRAIAVISVLLFHLNIPLFQGGFAGVDIFFVISGYLMTRIILEGYQDNTYTIIGFYIKRAKRIIPALLFLGLAVTLVAFFIYLPNQYKEVEKNASSSLLFYSNIMYWKNSGYFDSASINNVFLHTWSLSVEWQFYIAYPIVISLLLSFYKNKKYLNIFYLVLTLLFIGLSIFVTYKSPVASFFLLPTRTWELMLGGLAFIFEGKIKSKILLIAAYIAVILSTILLNEKLLWPGFYTLIPVIGTFIIVVINADDHIILKNKVVQFLGKISYSLYLWHWPLIVIARYMGYDLNAVNVVVIIALSIILAYLSFRFIESAKIFNIKWLIILSVVLGGLTFLLSRVETNKWLFKKSTITLADYTEAHVDEIHQRMSLNDCFVINHEEKVEDFLKKSCLTIDTTKKNVLLLGDSHAAALSLSFKEVFKTKNINLLRVHASQGFPFLNNVGDSEFARKIYRYLYHDFIIKNHKYINGVILEGNWFTGKTEVIEELKQTVAYLKKLNIPVVVIGQNNVFTITYPAIIAKWNESNADNIELYTNKQAYYYNEIYKEKLKPFYVDIYYYSNMPKINKDNEPFYIDNDHFSKFGSDVVVEKILKDKTFINTFLNKL